MVSKVLNRNNQMITQKISNTVLNIQGRGQGSLYLNVNIVTIGPSTDVNGFKRRE